MTRLSWGESITYSQAVEPSLSYAPSLRTVNAALFIRCSRSAICDKTSVPYMAETSKHSFPPKKTLKKPLPCRPLPLLWKTYVPRAGGLRRDGQFASSKRSGFGQGGSCIKRLRLRRAIIPERDC